jgi:hypothetical protein
MTTSADQLALAVVKGDTVGVEPAAHRDAGLVFRVGLPDPVPRVEADLAPVWPSLKVLKQDVEVVQVERGTLAATDTGLGGGDGRAH